MSEETKRIRAIYDCTVDVFPICLVGVVPECGEADEDGLIFMYDSSENPQAVEVLDLEDWKDKRDILANKIVDFLGCPVADVLNAIAETFLNDLEKDNTNYMYIPSLDQKMRGDIITNGDPEKKTTLSFNKTMAIICPVCNTSLEKHSSIETILISENPCQSCQDALSLKETSC